MRNPMTWAALPLAVLTLAACGDPKGKVGEDGVVQPTSQTLGEVVKGDGAFGTLEKAVDNAGLAAVLDGKGPYTVFAPADGPFEASGADFGSDAMKAEAAALIRLHIVPGALTRRDIEAAIARDSDGKVQMQTMGDGLLTFSRDGEVLKVMAADGTAALLTGVETIASNGVVQPINGLLAK